MDFIFRNTEASLNSAKQRYLNTGKVEPEVFDIFLKADFTASKKYLEWLCRMWCLNKDFGRLGEVYGPDVIPSFSKESIEYLLKRNPDRLSGLKLWWPEKIGEMLKNYESCAKAKLMMSDINDFYNFGYFRDSLEKAMSELSAPPVSYLVQSLKDGIDYRIVPCPSKDWILVKVLTYKASQRLGGDVGWCVVQGEDYFDSYLEKKYDAMFFAFLRGKFLKYCVHISLGIFSVLITDSQNEIFYEGNGREELNSLFGVVDWRKAIDDLGDDGSGVSYDNFLSKKVFYDVFGEGKVKVDALSGTVEDAVSFVYEPSSDSISFSITDDSRSVFLDHSIPPGGGFATLGFYVVSSKVKSYDFEFPNATKVSYLDVGGTDKSKSESNFSFGKTSSSNIDFKSCTFASVGVQVLSKSSSFEDCYFERAVVETSKKSSPFRSGSFKKVGDRMFSFDVDGYYNSRITGGRKSRLKSSGNGSVFNGSFRFNDFEIESSSSWSCRATNCCVLYKSPTNFEVFFEGDERSHVCLGVPVFFRSGSAGEFDDEYFYVMVKGNSGHHFSYADFYQSFTDPAYKKRSKECALDHSEGYTDVDLLESHVELLTETIKSGGFFSDYVFVVKSR